MGHLPGGVLGIGQGIQVHDGRAQGRGDMDRAGHCSTPAAGARDQGAELAQRQRAGQVHQLAGGATAAPRPRPPARARRASPSGSRIRRRPPACRWPGRTAPPGSGAIRPSRRSAPAPSRGAAKCRARAGSCPVLPGRPRRRESDRPVSPACAPIVATRSSSALHFVARLGQRFDFTRPVADQVIGILAAAGQHARDARRMAHQGRRQGALAVHREMIAASKRQLGAADRPSRGTHPAGCRRSSPMPPS